MLLAGRGTLGHFKSPVEEEQPCMIFIKLLSCHSDILQISYSTMYDCLAVINSVDIPPNFQVSCHCAIACLHLN